MALATLFLWYKFPSPPSVDSRGMVEPWVKFHTETLVPLLEKHGIKVEGSWVNEDNNQYIWIRTFDDAEDREVKYGSVARVPRVEICERPRLHSLGAA